MSDVGLPSALRPLISVLRHLPSALCPALPSVFCPLPHGPPQADQYDRQGGSRRPR